MSSLDLADAAAANEGPQAKPHGFVTKGIHWLAAGLLAFGYFKGLDRVSQLNDTNLFWTEVGFAIAIGVLFAFRWIWTKRVAGHTRLPDEAPWWEHYASRFVHLGLYASVFGIVLSGLGIALGFATPLLDGLFLDAMVGLHEFTLAALPIFLIVHIAGALWHGLVRRDGVMESMTMRWRKA